MSAGRQGRRAGDSAATAHELRSSLNAIHMWAHVLQGRLRLHADPEVRQALDGLRSSVDAHLRLVENLIGGRAVEPPLRSVTMSKRNDAQPDLPDDPPRRERPQRPETEPNEAPGGRDAAQREEDARNKSTRNGER